LPIGPFIYDNDAFNLGSKLENRSIVAFPVTDDEFTKEGSKEMLNRKNIYKSEFVGEQWMSGYRFNSSNKNLIMKIKPMFKLIYDGTCLYFKEEDIEEEDVSNNDEVIETSAKTVEEKMAEKIAANKKTRDSNNKKRS